MQQVVFLRKLRDFGEKISDSLLFLKGNWKKLFAIYAVFVVPFILIAVIAGLFFASHIYDRTVVSVETLKPSDIFNAQFFVILLGLLLAGASYQTSVYTYFRLYNEKNGVSPSIPEVGQAFARKFLRVFLYNIATTIVLFVAAAIPMVLLIMVPIINIFAILLIAVFFMVVFLYLNCIYVVEDGGLINGFTRLFELMRNQWWNTIGYTLVVTLIFYVFSFVIQLIFMIVAGVASINFLSPNTMEPGTSTRTMISGWVLIFGAMMLVQQLFYIIVFSGVAVNYYSLVEEKDGSAIEERIDTIGSGTDKYGGIEEQY